MESVFVAGSRALSRLSPQIRQRLDNIMERHLTVLVGDANGADKAVQRYLAKSRYGRVTVYCMDSCRNNVGEWPIRFHKSEPGVKRDRHYYGIKDAAMAEDATCGFMLWDGVSKGTAANTINLLNSRKRVVLYLSPQKQFFTLRTVEDFKRAAEAYGLVKVSPLRATAEMAEIATEHLPFK